MNFFGWVKFYWRFGSVFGFTVPALVHYRKFQLRGFLVVTLLYRSSERIEQWR